jgi:hypothetical protein
MLSLQNPKLLAQCENFKAKIVARSEERTEKGEKVEEIWSYGPDLYHTESAPILPLNT